ncbi:very-long-chain 3-oxoacyl-CoA reductase-like isoform X1 [Clavelina lepadiformis]|uniref:very-long-chain 3-oxoacyl-CoA reductase-like isoform X1 n=1 Tax=Clavelina lepadiformis TaxID=159417 RepID=UPI004042FF43
MVFQWIGIATTTYLAIKLVYYLAQGAYLYFFRTYPDFNKYGKWSVITGATDGIGKETAFQLASRGQNIALISRNRERLKNVAKKIESEHNVQTKCLAIDFSGDEEIYNKIADFLQGLDIGTLVNNVGTDQELVRFLEQSNLSLIIRNLVRVHIMSILKMTQIVLPGMVERKRGLILNLSAFTILHPIGKFAITNATKSFINLFSQALSYEYESEGITIQSCRPGAVGTKLSQQFGDLEKMTSPKDYCASWLATVDKARWTHGHWQHAVEAWVWEKIPTGLVQKLADYFYMEPGAKIMKELEKKK